MLQTMATIMGMKIPALAMATGVLMMM